MPINNICIKVIYHIEYITLQIQIKNFIKIFLNIAKEKNNRIYFIQYSLLGQNLVKKIKNAKLFLTMNLRKLPSNKHFKFSLSFFTFLKMPIAGIRKHLRNTVLSILLIHLVKFWSMNLLSLFFFNRPITA